MLEPTLADRADIQARFDEWFPGGVTFTMVDEDGNEGELVATPRVIVTGLIGDPFLYLRVLGAYNGRVLYIPVRMILDTADPKRVVDENYNTYFLRTYLTDTVKRRFKDMYEESGEWLDPATFDSDWEHAMAEAGLEVPPS